MKKILIAAGMTSFSSGAAFAHPGEHAFTIAASVYHLLTEPDHLAMMAGAIIIAAALIYKFKRRSV
jgi:hydrogenase/urease accessory protein HupE